MKFVFWQNIVSLHQSSFLKSLAERHEVILVAHEALDSNRSSQGWSIPSMGKVKVVISPKMHEIDELLNQEARHVFSGIDAFPSVYQVFKKAYRRNADISVMMEPYEWAGFKGLMRNLKYRILFFRYGKKLMRLFATGNKGQECFEKSGFPTSRIFQWGYFTEKSPDAAVTKNDIRKPSILFVGQLDENKNIRSVLDIWAEIGDRACHLTIIGKGVLEHYVRESCSKYGNVEFLGTKTNDAVRRIMSEHDVLILPSKYDGWGAVVNEALSVGTRVLCSENCGASILLDGIERGESFRLDSIKDCLCKWLDMGPLSSTERSKIKNWADNHISGVVAAEYFVKCFSNEKAVAPWLR